MVLGLEGSKFMKGRVSILVLVTLHGHFHETNPWRTKLMLLSSRCLSVHVSHTSGVYTKPFQQYWRQKWPGLLAEMTWSTSRDDMACAIEVHFLFETLWLLPLRQTLVLMCLHFQFHLTLSTLHGLHTVSLMEAAICVHVCVCGWVGVYTLCIRNI